MSVSFHTKPSFSGSPVSTVEALARALNIDVLDLRTLAGAASSLYTDFQIEKRDGSMRKVSGPRYDLKVIQKRINRQLFERVHFPDYLYGGLVKRNYVQNARVHSNAQVVVALDVKNFYPSISANATHHIFKHFFCFPDTVAEVLTALCTKDGSVPQGACTSSYIANLVLYRIEHRLVRSLTEQGLLYTRLMDDISISSSKPISKARSESVISQVAAMLKSEGFKLKNRKTRISSAANPKELMEITGLWLNRGEPRVKRDERQGIRADVRRCISESKVERTSDEYHALHAKVSGRVAKLTHLGHHEAARYRRALRLCMPTYSNAAVAKTLAMIRVVAKTPSKSRASIAYVDRYHQAMHRIGLLGRTNPDLAKELRAKMSKCYPPKRKEDIIHGK